MATIKQGVDYEITASDKTAQATDSVMKRIDEMREKEKAAAKERKAQSEAHQAEVQKSKGLVQAMGAAAVGLNCSVGPDQLESVVNAMKAVAEVPIIAKPNAGMPVMDEFGMAHYSMSPEAFATAMKKLVWRGARLVGGCCGTDPEYIRLLAQTVKG